MIECLAIGLALLLGRRFSADWGLALGIGLGLSSLTYWLSLLGLGQAGPLCLVFEGVLILALKPRPASPKKDLPPAPGWLWMLFGASQLLALAGLLYRHASHPHGDWDAYAIWNCRARFLYSAGADWACAFSEPWSHPDYPLLVPVAVVRLWTLAGHPGQWAPQLLSAAFWVATQLFLSAWLWRGGRPTAALFCGCLLPLPGYLDQVSALYADVPLSFFLLAVPLLLGPAPVLAGLCAGLAAWTKSEGVLPVLWGGLWLLRGRRAKDLAWFALGCLPGLATLLAFKLSFQLAALSWLTTSHPLTQMADLSRLKLVLSHWLWRACGGGALASLHGLLWLAVAAVGLDRRRSFQASHFFLLATTASYLWIYWISPYPLAWHLETSCDRLLLQLWPLSLACALSLLEIDEPGPAVV